LLTREVHIFSRDVDEIVEGLVEKRKLVYVRVLADLEVLFEPANARLQVLLTWRS